MEHFTVYTKHITTNGCYRIATVGKMNNIDKNIFHHLMQILRLKGSPEVPKNNFAYTFGFNLGGQR